MESNTENKHITPVLTMENKQILGLHMESNAENKHNIQGFLVETKQKNPGSNIKFNAENEQESPAVWNTRCSTHGTLSVKGKNTV